MEAEELDELIEVLRTDCLYETVEERGEDIGWLVGRQHRRHYSKVVES